VLNSLEKTGLVETVPDSSPKRWRLAERHLRDPILKASRVIRVDEWTTYGDIAIAVGGNKNGARAVGRVAATHPAFANPHRVINQGGIINPSWRGMGGGPEECRRRLESEKVRFAGDAADPKCRISWEEIDERLRAVEHPS
jgi:alkylated DNA nucleotide flippase Atl1